MSIEKMKEMKDFSFEKMKNPSIEKVKDFFILTNEKLESRLL